VTRHPKPGCIICRDGTGIRVEARDGALVVTALTRDGLRAKAGLAEYKSVGGEAGIEIEHAGVPVDVVRNYVRLHHGVEAIHPVALAILRGEAPTPEATTGGVEAAPPRPFWPRWPELLPPRPLTGRAGWWTPWQRQ
jgi:hypothetical protein